MDTNPIVELAEEAGLVTDEAIIRRIKYYEPRELDNLYDSLLGGLRANNRDAYNLTPSSFNFFASSAMRGDRFCIHAECRLRKLPLIARYASLYSDKVLLPIRMSDHSKRSKRLSVETTLRAVASMRPLVDAGIVIPIATGLNICRDCRPLVEKEAEAVANIGRHVAVKNIDRFKAGYYWDKKKSKHIFILLPPEELSKEGGGIVNEFNQLPAWFAGPGKEARELAQVEIINSGMVAKLYNASAFDIFTQAAMAKGNGCSYLSDSDTEAAFFDDPDYDVQGCLSRSQFATSLMHNVPMFQDLDVNSILALRREFPDSFTAYRSALNAAIAERTDLMTAGERRTKEFFRDVIEPRVDELRALDSGVRLTTVKTIGTSLAIPVVSLLFGLLDHNLPHTITEAAKILGGAGVAKAIIDPIVDGVKRETAVRSNPYFFLLKLDRKWKADRDSCRSHIH